MMNNVYELTKELYAAKAREEEAKSARMALEEKLAEAVGVPNGFEGSRSSEIGEFKVTAKRSMNIKIDGVMLEDIIRAHCINEALVKSAFRTKYELNKKNWDGLDLSVQGLFSDAITKTPGRISFSVEIKKED